MTSKDQTLWKDLSPAEQRKITDQLKSERGQREPKMKPSRPPVFQLKGYVRCELSTIDKTEFKAWFEAEKPIDVYDLLLKAVDSGYLFKVGVGKEGYTASLSAFDTGKGYDGYVLTAFAGTAPNAIAVLMFKHHIMLKTDWSDAAEPATDDFFR
jgi:hypothetical protein